MIGAWSADGQVGPSMDADPCITGIGPVQTQGVTAMTLIAMSFLIGTFALCFADSARR